jgi:tRNA 2-selenouridine synthase
MPASLSPAEFLAKSQSFPIIDVRSPAEYAHAHIPGAINIPLFNNEERAKVGTCYKQAGKDAAVLLGLKLVGPKLASFVTQSKALNSPDVLVHCWRGGMRSGSFAWLLETAGMRVSTLAGGYKAYRNHLLQSFSEPQNILVLGGTTGSGKTDTLHALQKLGEQIIDLETLAHHKGSSFGMLGQAAQPSTEQFENQLYQVWQQLDPTKRTWIEDESRRIGSCLVPIDLWQQIQTAPVVVLNVPLAERIQFLVKHYGCFDRQLLREALDRIKKRLGGQHHQTAIEALAQGDYAKVAEIALVYYDKAYRYDLAKRHASQIREISVTSTDAIENAATLLQWANSL